MPNYKEMYFSLFNAVSDAVEILKEAQRNGEKAYMDSEEVLLHIVRLPAAGRPNTDMIIAEKDQ